MHDWMISPEDACDLQNRLRPLRILDDEHPPIEHVGGVDVSYSKTSRDACCIITVFSYPGLDLKTISRSEGEAVFPYIPGLLTFREGPLIEQAFERLEIVPDVLVFDGYGICHPRGMGIATHMGIILGCATIGCAKTPFVGTYREPGTERGSTSLILYRGGIVGAALRTKKGVRPVFVSQGHKVSLETSVEVCLACTPRYRIPEPVRRAHLHAGKCIQRTVQ